VVLKAVFDGQVFRPVGPVPDGLRPGDEVEVGPPADAPPSPTLSGATADARIDLEDGRPPVVGEPYAAFKFLLQNPVAAEDINWDGWPEGRRIHSHDGGEQ
jgi:hypothetical protein